MSVIRSLSDRSRLATFVVAVVALFALGAGLGEIVGPIDVGSGHDDHPVTSTTMGPNMDMSTHAPAG